MNSNHALQQDDWHTESSKTKQELNTSHSDSPDKAASAQNIATFAFALLNVHAEIVSANAEFAQLLNISIEDKNLCILDTLSSHFPSHIEELAHALQQKTSSVLELHTANNIHYRLHFASLENEQRMLIAELSVDNKIDVADSQQSLIDPLTNLGNRRLLEQSLESWEPINGEQHMALIMMDLDRFKQVNDTLGHGIGDSLLKLVAKRFKRSAHQDDIAMRLGGDEFVILHAIDERPSNAEAVAQRLVEMMGRPFLINGHQIVIGASVGIAVLDKGTNQIDDLLRHADLALYEAKNSGRAAYRFFNPRMEQLAIERRELEINLRSALGLKQFSLVYQPQVQLPHGDITGFEALIRWHHDKLGLVSPMEFIPLAEETGEIVAIGEWVLRTACWEAMKWPDHLNVAVNVSPIQFESDRFIDSICDALSSTGLDPKRLEVEITESVLINNPDTVLGRLCAIKDMGVSIAMDDFGTGYSSLSSLSDFPFSKIKIDQAFIRGEQDEKSRALVNAIIALGVNLGMDTLAEGVETLGQFNQLATDGCMSAQGYLISKPLSAVNIDQFLAERNKTASGSKN